MRTLLLIAAAIALLTVGAGQTMLRWHADSATAQRVPQFREPIPILLRLAPVDTVPYGQFEQQLSRLTQGNVVLDMRALESLEAAEDLVLHWRSQHAVDAHLVCWLAPADIDLATGVRVLSGAGCSALRVALDGARRAQQVIAYPPATVRDGLRVAASKP